MCLDCSDASSPAVLTASARAASTDASPELSQLSWLLLAASVTAALAALASAASVTAALAAFASAASVTHSVSPDSLFEQGADWEATTSLKDQLYSAPWSRRTMERTVQVPAILPEPSIALPDSCLHSLVQLVPEASVVLSNSCRTPPVQLVLLSYSPCFHKV